MKGLTTATGRLARFRVQRALESKTTLSLVRGEHYLAELGVHPRILEAMDHMNGISNPRSRDAHYRMESLADELQKHPKLVNQVTELSSQHPSARELFTGQLTSILVAASRSNEAGKVVFRTTDFKTNELAHLAGGELVEAKERNPAMGNRGLGRYLQESHAELFQWELEACRRAASHRETTLGIVFPLVRHPGELAEGLRMVLDASLDLAAIGIMVETPGNVIQASEFADVLLQHTRNQGRQPLFLFGLGDLTQSTRRADRGNPAMSKLYDETSLSVQRSVMHVLGVAGSRNVQCGIHASTLESIAERSPEFALVIATHTSWLAVDFPPPFNLEVLTE